MLRRKAYEQLAIWKNISNGKTAALIEGARRIGKSTVAEAFAQAEYADYLLLDFTRESEDLKLNFVENIGDLDTFFRNLFLLKGKALPKGDSVIIFDEVQLFPFARQSIKELVRDGRYHYIETGSLISIKTNKADILIPSEEHKIKMHPLDFEEYLWAREDYVTADAIREAFEKKSPLGSGVHRKIMKEFRTYLAIGGMPQAVKALVEGSTFDQIDFIKQAIISLYLDDLRKYDNEEHGRVSAIFKAIPEQLSTQNRSFKFASVEKGSRYSRLIDSLDFLEESMMVNLCENVTSPDVLMELYAQKENFKLFMGDTGLLVTHAMGGTRDALYKTLVFDKTDANLGMIMENMVAQMLTARGHELHFHEFKFQPEDAKRPGRYEIDFLTVREKRVCPIEVKSSGYRAHKSLDYFFEKYHVKANERYVLNTKDVMHDGSVTYLPLYMAMCL